MSKPVLQQPSVRSFIGQDMSAAMPQHVRVHVHVPQACLGTVLFADVADVSSRYFSTALRQVFTG